jgi:hypothetical protein
MTNPTHQFRGCQLSLHKTKLHTKTLLKVLLVTVVLVAIPKPHEVNVPQLKQVPMRYKVHISSIPSMIMPLQSPNHKDPTIAALDAEYAMPKGFAYYLHDDVTGKEQTYRQLLQGPNRDHWYANCEKKNGWFGPRYQSQD